MENYIRETKSASRRIPSSIKTLCQPPIVQILPQYARPVFSFPSTNAFPPVQRMASLGEIASGRFRQKLYSYWPDGRLTAVVYRDTSHKPTLLLKLANPGVYAQVTGLIPNIDTLIHA